MLLVEPLFHIREGHYSEEVKSLGRALSAEGVDVHLITFFEPDKTIPDMNIHSIEKRSHILFLLTASLFRQKKLYQYSLYSLIMNNFITFLCMRLSSSVGGANTITLCVSGQLLSFSFYSAVFSNLSRVLIYTLRDFTRFERKRKMRSRLIQALENITCQMAMKRNTIHFLRILESSTYYEVTGFRCRTTYIPPIGVSGSAKKTSREKAREILGLPSEGKLLLVFGTGHIGKDYITIFKAVPHIGNGVYIVFAGKTSAYLENNPDKLVVQYNCRDRVILRNHFIVEEEVPLYFSAADGLLLSYQNRFLVDSGVLVKGVEYDLPIIGNESGSIGMYMKKWNLGLCFKANDPVSLAEQIDTFVNLEKRDLAEFARGRERFSEYYSWKRVAGDHISLYKKLLAQTQY